MNMTDERLREATKRVREYMEQYADDGPWTYEGIARAALAHDRPSGSAGLLRELEQAEALYSHKHVSDGGNPPFTGWEIPEDLFNRVRAALSGSSGPEAVGLDVERLRQALINVNGHIGSGNADSIAAEYARLSGSSDPKTPWGADDDGDHSAFTHGDDAP